MVRMAFRTWLPSAPPGTGERWPSEARRRGGFPRPRKRSFDEHAHDRLHHRRRRAGRLRARQPAERGPGHLGDAARGRRQRLASPDPYARRLRQDDQGHRLLGLVDRAAEAHEGPRLSLHPGQGDRRRLLHQRADLHARQRPRLRRLGEGRGSVRLGLSRRAALLQARREQRALRQRFSRRQRPARRLQPGSAAADLRGLFPRRPGTRHPLQSGLQRTESGRRRLLPTHAEKRPPFLGLHRLSEADPRQEKSHRPYRRDGDPRRGRKGQGDRRRARCRSRAASRKFSAPIAKSSSAPAPSARQSC